MGIAIGSVTETAWPLTNRYGRRDLSVAFEVEDIPASASRAGSSGALQTRIKATGKLTATQFAIVLMVRDGVVTRFQMLEDSFGVSKACARLKPSDAGV